MSIKVENLSFAYGKKNVLNDISFHVKEGELLALLGPNGVGKTTLFRCILGIQSKKYTGNIYLNDQDIRSFNTKQLAHNIAYIPQTHGHVFNYQVKDMVLMGTSHKVSSFAVPGKKEREAAEAAMKRVGIEWLANKNYAHLSGGEQQLVLIARALAQQAKILIMDEPTSALDFGNQTHVLEQVYALSREGYTVILSTHNPQQAFWYAEKVLALKNGTVAAFGAPNEVLTADLVYHLYGIKSKFLESEAGYVIVPEKKSIKV
ncbi:MAG: ABC transporter ATP-binding protein [Eubacterium sp.]|nr:ABC transporter ATP-binding protein [Eubacterium sp.]